ncbi:hypothetical protein [Arthrospiribacter ruber]|uniref:Uncharacterized protein n=1 Tax=Arthrospiribacter ruber TaxID=2487934 RepID=A0A951IXB7_9BACT|nr:hypothetical protein [Arthrospiribacter ruber]MBW3467999.1 hypothetical protein [Arthrospiribacter ruber]
MIGEKEDWLRCIEMLFLPQEKIKNLLYCFLILNIIACTPQIDDLPPFQLANDLTVDGQRLVFQSARFSLTGAIEVNEENSHVFGVLELSTDEDFSSPPNSGGSIIRYPLYSVNNEISLPAFPMESGRYTVINETDFEVNNSVLQGENFVFPAEVFLSSNIDGTWAISFSGESGTVQVQFDIQAGLVQVSNSWRSAEGQHVNGTVALPLNYGTFRP